MIISRFKTLCSIAFLFSSILSLHAQDAEPLPELSDAERAQKKDEAVELARSYLGAEKALEGVSSIKMDGVLVYGNGASGTVEAYYKSPNYHQFISVFQGTKETSTLDRNEAWRKIEDLRTPNSYTMSFYEPDDVRHLAATVSDYLSFLKTPPTRKGRIEYLGTSVVDGQDTIVLLYIHNDRIWFRRYIDPETGRVLHMVNDKGIVFSYEGEIEAGGIKFPERTIVRVVTQYGQQSMEISFSNIVVNEPMDAERFRVPSAGE